MSMPELFSYYSVIEDYDIYWDQKLGSGVNGDVYLCRNIHENVEYAVKILPDNEEARKEACFQLLCSNSNYIVKVRDVYVNVMTIEHDQTEDCLFVIMELMSGGELFDYLQSNTLNEDSLKILMHQIVSAVAYMHSQNLVHRDLKPENILITSYNDHLCLKLADFGYTEKDNNDLLGALYTCYYAAPEVLRNDARFNKKLGAASSATPYNKKCDLWSIGVIAYIMLLGYPPFFPESQEIEMTPTMYRHIVNGDYFLEGSDWSSISPNARKFITDLLKVDPKERPSAEQLLKHPWLKI